MSKKKKNKLNQIEEKKIDNNENISSTLEEDIKERIKALNAKKEMLERQEKEEQITKINKIKEELNDKYEAKEEIKKEDTIKIPKIHEARTNFDDIKIETKKKKINYFLIFGIIVFLGSLINIGYNAFINDSIDKIYNIIYSSLISLIILTALLYKKKVMKYLGLIFICLIILLPFVKANEVIELPKLEGVPNFVGMKLDEALSWGNEHNITIDTVYEYSDTYAEYIVMMQDVKEDTVLKNIDKITLTISEGPNYDKTAIISNMVGWNIDDVVEVINKNFLNNVTIDFEFNDEVKRDIVMSQSYSGEMRRNDPLSFVVSLGLEEDLKPVDMIDLKGKSLFEATLFLKRNGIKYNLEYDYSDKIKKDYVISQSELAGTTINQKDVTVTLIISKGKEIKVPNLVNMTTDEIVTWIIENNLKIKFIEKYDILVEKGKVISANYKENDIISEGTTIEITISKGQLTLPDLKDLNEFRTWASNNGVNYREEYEFNSDVAEGTIIKFNLPVGEVINPSDTLIVYISNGTAVKVPNFYGMTKTEATNKCKSVGLTCTFYNVNSSKTKGTAVAQNKKANTTVTKGTTVKIGLSTGTTGGGGGSTCDTSKGATVYLGNGSTGAQSLLISQQQNPDFNIIAEYVDSCPNGATTSGMICNAPTYNGQWVSYCTTIKLTIVR